MRIGHLYSYFYGRGNDGGRYANKLGINTTSDGKQVFLVVGDSNATGHGESIPEVAENTLFLWNGSGLDEITTQSVSEDDSKGSIWQQFATDYKTREGKKTVLVNAGSGGSEFYPNIDNNNWYTSGALYSAAQASVSGALAYVGLTKLKAIFLNLGVNDVRSSNSSEEIQVGIDSLFERLTTDYPGVPILCIQIGGNNTGADTLKFYKARKALVEKAEEYEDVHMVANAAAFIGVEGGYNDDGLHYSQATNDIIGSQIARWFSNLNYSKWGRSVICSHFDDLSSRRKALLDEFISNQHANGNYHKLDHLSIYKTSNENNILNDYSFLGYNTNGGATLTEDVGLVTNGSSTFFTIGYNAATHTDRSSQNDNIVGVKLAARTTLAGTAACLMGRSGNSVYMRIAQSTSLVNCHNNGGSADQLNGTDNSFTPGLWATARNGISQLLIKGKIIHASVDSPSTGLCVGRLTIGAFNGSSLWFGGTFEYSFAAKYSDFNLDSFVDGMEALITSW